MEPVWELFAWLEVINEYMKAGFGHWDIQIRLLLEGGGLSIRLGAIPGKTSPH